MHARTQHVNVSAMCDTQVLIGAAGTWFAKNSDREPSEAQPVVRLPAVRGDQASRVQTTYLDIPQVPDRHAVILSKPHWMWGAEIGTNDAGVVIGNEAIFSKLRTLEPGLLGMDLLRLGLERGATAQAALQVITRHLETYGQGGPAGFRDKKFHYDNSFIIADPEEAWVLETAGRAWVAKKVEKFHAISNCLTLGSDYDLSSDNLGDEAARCGHRGGPVDFAGTFDTRLMPFFAGSHQRVAVAQRCLANRSENGASLAGMIEHLRTHAAGNEAPLAGSNADLCMHAAGPIRRSQSCGSMISHLSPSGATHLLTGTSAPCLSLFRPVGFDDHDYSVLSASNAQPSLWHQYEPIHRRALFDAGFRARLRQSRNAAEQNILRLVEKGDSVTADREARDWMQTQLSALPEQPTQLPRNIAGYWWRYLNQADGL